MDKVITISREFGSGGRELGVKLADKLGIPFYDKELISMAADDINIAEEAFRHYDEHIVVYDPLDRQYYHAFSDVYQIPMSDQIFVAQSNVIRRLASHGPCIIVGRCADMILTDSLNLFIYAKMKDRIKRMLELESEAESDGKEMERRIREVDRKRKEYYQYYTGNTWGRAQNYHTAFTVPVQIGLALVTAVAVKRKGWLNGFFKSVYFIPAICSMTIVSILWSFLVNPDIGMFCYWAKLLGFNPINVLNSPTWAMPTVILVSVWKNFGFNMVILLAGLNGIDESYYEAANIDGATGFQKFRGITIPMLMPTLSFTVVNCIIGSFQVFDQVYIMTKGGPLFKTQTLVQLIYSMAFDSFNMGYASTIAVALFIITFIISVFTFKHMTKGEEDLG